LGWSIAMQAMGTQPLQKSTRIVTLLQISFLLAFFLKIYTSIPILYKLFSLNPLKVTKKKKESLKPSNLTQHQPLPCARKYAAQGTHASAIPRVY
jgi:hypothetical protein